MILIKNLKLFPVFILVKIGHENLLEDILEKKNSVPKLWKQEVKY